ncbi:unnamed protein product [Rhizophagus irregularis]|nr:unnamed protein product [Rhizophagus irregularis]
MKGNEIIMLINGLTRIIRLLFLLIRNLAKAIARHIPDCPDAFKILDYIFTIRKLKLVRRFRIVEKSRNM